MDSVRSSKQLSVPEIIMQTANVEDDCEIRESALIRNDGIIQANASLAKALLDDIDCPKDNKVFIGIKAGHFDSIKDLSLLAQKIEMLLHRQRTAM